MLHNVRPCKVISRAGLGQHTVKETSSSMILNLAARLDKFSLTSRATFSRCVISWLALNCATTLLSTSLTMDGSTRSS